MLKTYHKNKASREYYRGKLLKAVKTGRVVCSLTGSFQLENLGHTFLGRTQSIQRAEHPLQCLGKSLSPSSKYKAHTCTKCSFPIAPPTHP